MGIQAEIGHRLGYHWFNLLGDTVVDVTSTQFGHPDRVAILPFEKARRIGWWWNPDERLSEVVEPWDPGLIADAEREFARISLADLTGLARIARVVFERVAKRDDWKSDLGGLCYDASAFLYRLATKDGILVELGSSGYHWFVLFGDTVVDVTATQFGWQDRIAVLPLVEVVRKGV
jgi:hypothetical protein